MRELSHWPIKLLCFFFFLFFIIAFFLQRDFPIRVVAGEDSPGTWMSGALLVIAATTSLVISNREGWWPWSLFFVFFVVLALDERFMFHEQIKEYLIFSLGKSTPRLIYELPVMLGACVGVCIAFMLWHCVNKGSRVLLMCAALLGSLSVTLDVLNVATFFEETSKLAAELFICCAVMRKAE
jgi:hypothetical protein